MDRVSRYQNELQVYSAISKIKNTIVKFYAVITGVTIKVKYFNIQKWSQDKINFYMCALSNINYHLYTPYQSKLTQKMKIYRSASNIFVEDKFIANPNVQHLLSHTQTQQNNEKQLLLKKFIRKMPFYLLDCFINTIDFNHLILNESNIYVESIQLISNNISFTGIDLLVFEQSIHKNQFMQIYNFIDSKIFDRKPCERINYRQKIKNFAAILLTFICNKPIRLLKSRDIPQIVTVQLAKKQLSMSSSRFQKYLSIKGIRKNINERSKLINSNLDLYPFFRRILVEQQDISWSQIKDYFTFVTIDNESGSFIYNFANDIWKKLSVVQRKYFCDKRIVAIKQQDSYIGTGSQLFFTMMLGQRISTLKNGSIFSTLQDKRFDMRGQRIINRFTKLINLTIDRSDQIITRAQSSEEHIKYLEKILRQIDQIKSEQSQSIDYSHSDYSQQSTSKSYYSSAEIQQSRQQGDHIFFEENGIVMSTQQKLNKLYSIIQDKLTHAFETQGKNVKVEQQRLKSLKAFEYAFR